MYNPDDKDIDRLSREAAEHYNAPGKPAWDALRATLDKELPQEKEKKRRGFLFFFVLATGLLLGGGLVWYASSTQHPRPVTQKLPAATPPASKQSANTPAAPSTTNNDNDAATNTGTPSNTPVTDHAAVSAATANTSGSRPPVNADDAKTSNTIAKKASPINNNRSVTKRSDKIIAHSNDYTLSAAVTGTSRKKHLRGENTRDANKIGTTASTDINLDPLKTDASPTGLAKQRTKTFTPHHKTMDAGKVSNLDADNTISQETTTLADTGHTATAALTETAVKQPIASHDTTIAKKTVAPVSAVPGKDSMPKSASVKQKPEKAILFGITAGVDLSTIKFSYSSNAGFNIGVMGGYQFSPHWSVYTGAVYTKKNYKLDGEDYHPPKHYWTTYVQLETVDGYCRMWDIPVLARYTFNPKDKNVFFASAGLSSYFMTSQYYNYNYKTGMGSMNSAWTDDSTFRHMFSILDLSLGVQKQVGKHMNLQIEPYAKIPLGGVGFGNIRLSSFGVNVNLQYKKLLKH